MSEPPWRIVRNSTPPGGSRRRQMGAYSTRMGPEIQKPQGPAFAHCGYYTTSRGRVKPPSTRGMAGRQARIFRDLVSTLANGLRLLGNPI